VSYSNVAATLAVVLGLSGTAYATGATAALEGPEARTVGFQGVVNPIAGNSSEYVFAGPSAELTLKGGERLTGAASAPMGLSKDAPRQTADVGLCYQLIVSRAHPAGKVRNFVGANFSAHLFTATRATYSATATIGPDPALVPGIYRVGMCVRNNGNSAINDNNFVNGWVRVTDES
jgi:hypothetical protein